MNQPSKEITFLAKKPSTDRYIYTLKKIADFEEAWGLYDKGWALTGSECDDFFPIWPSKESASICATDSWGEYSPNPIPVDQLLNNLLPMLIEDNVKIAIFMVPGSSETATKKAQEFKDDLENELEKYE
ncbi:DUF2750 domain-containing protein [Halomonas sp. DP5N14-9]|uniref:DUF2750 domain-containing protein n=1 Tax=Halomonas sp. DP5N14-9 TaxID=2859075 RepID=UPI001C993726|nr:DUF2750 domain-containing protein [Halomonas sp. DP5N14-9]MBY5943517.1 DUF2750 domain-containing protein [Halomonas sp. DP5N14-9]